MAADDTMLDLFERSSSRVVVPGHDPLTAAEIAARGKTLAAALRERGHRPGDRLAVWLPNGPGYLIALAACAAGRFVAVSVNTRFTAAEAADLIGRAGATIVLADGDPARPVPSGLAAIDPSTPIVATGADGDTPMPADRFVVFTTSGTTGKPKMVVHTHRSIATHAHDAAAGFAMSSADVVLAAMPLCGTFGLTTLTSALAADAAIVMPHRFDPADVAAAIVDHGVTITQGSDDMFHRLLEHGADLSGLRCAGHARFNASLDGIVDRADAAGLPLVGLYGMSEVQALYAHRDPDAPAAERALAGGTVVASDAAARVEDGELWLRGPSMFEGYLAEGGADIDHDLTGTHFTDGWFRTGDLADADPTTARRFTFQARIGDAMRLGGFLVSPSEIERVIIEIDGVADAQVVAVDRPGGTRPVAFVVPADDAAPIDDDAARRWCEARLARSKVPVRFITIDAFPTTQSANGTKIRRGELRHMAEAALAAEPTRP